MGCLQHVYLTRRVNRKVVLTPGNASKNFTENRKIKSNIRLSGRNFPHNTRSHKSQSLLIAGLLSRH